MLMTCVYRPTFVTTGLLFLRVFERVDVCTCRLFLVILMHACNFASAVEVFNKAFLLTLLRTIFLTEPNILIGIQLASATFMPCITVDRFPVGAVDLHSAVRIRIPSLAKALV